jgi:hypothetical protein
VMAIAPPGTALPSRRETIMRRIKVLRRRVPVRIAAGLAAAAAAAALTASAGLATASASAASFSF